MGGSTQHRKIIPLLKSGQRLDLALRKKLQESKRSMTHCTEKRRKKDLNKTYHSVLQKA